MDKVNEVKAVLVQVLMCRYNRLTNPITVEAIIEVVNQFNVVYNLTDMEKLTVVGWLVARYI